MVEINLEPTDSMSYWAIKVEDVGSLPYAVNPEKQALGEVTKEEYHERFDDETTMFSFDEVFSDAYEEPTHANLYRPEEQLTYGAVIRRVERVTSNLQELADEVLE